MTRFLGTLPRSVRVRVDRPARAVSTHPSHRIFPSINGAFLVVVSHARARIPCAPGRGWTSAFVWGTKCCVIPTPRAESLHACRYIVQLSTQPSHWFLRRSRARVLGSDPLLIHITAQRAPYPVSP
ncbi:hypothetical protein HYPSUDRAFT_38147 [Hypholoma sublateritium FD-334 SS-4]|uniref:Uncharacterized protein n=1 Tax=Hypholoma sublateritium (strain FD-334 SS-4) TaxID=945553 RepID=A0A0D2Q0Z5_HYPSF|nr:hypothetical protein HYPSUDRAFT_38147 [Hypholoma sublateritium FD-334 SS-4]